MKKINLIILLSALVVNKIQAQQHNITLEESKTAALNYSYAIKNSKLYQQDAEWSILSAKSNAYPSVRGIGAITYGFKDFVKPIPTILDNGIDNFYVAGITAMQPLYTGGKITTGNQLAAVNKEVQLIRANQSKDSVNLLTEQKYWSLVSLQEKEKTLAANEILINGLIKQMQDMLASGLIARNDLLKVKVRKSEINLNKSKLDNGKKLAIFDLSMYIGVPFDSLTHASDKMSNIENPEKIFLSPEQALLNNNDIHLLSKNIEAEKLQTQLTKADDMPSVSVGVTATQFGSIGNSGLNTFMPTAVGIVTVPISERLWGSNKYKIKQREVAESIAQNRLEDAQRLVKLGILKSWYDVVDAYKQIQYAKENEDAAKENFKVLQDNYTSGLANVTDLLDAQASFETASNSVVEAYANYRSKMAGYNYYIGRSSSN